jgi:hypothetical protein
MTCKPRTFAAGVLVLGAAILVYGCPESKRKGPRPNTTAGESVEVDAVIVEEKVPEKTEPEKEKPVEPPAEPSNEPPAPEEKSQEATPSESKPQEAPAEPKSEQP